VVFNEGAARAVLARALGSTALAGRDDRAELIRLGSNAVFRFGPDVVVRVTPPDPDAVGVRRGLAVSQWLDRVDFPAVRALGTAELDAVQPVEVGRHLVTFWHALGPPEVTGTTRDLGELLRTLHALAPPPELGTPPAPPMDPVGRARSQLPLAPLPPQDRGFLLRRLDVVADGYAGLDFPLGHGLLHGDATVANVVPDRDGRPTLIDFDLLRTGPREWDLMRTATYYRRLGWHTPDEYRDFCAGYGVDVTDWTGFDVTADLGELLQIAWLAEAASHRSALVPELRTRLDTLRTDGSRRTWRAG
jgi:Ser/Thr protein kinase RdoA (MazF antagonist)